MEKLKFIYVDYDSRTGSYKEPKECPQFSKYILIPAWNFKEHFGCKPAEYNDRPDPRFEMQLKINELQKTIAAKDQEIYELNQKIGKIVEIYKKKKNVERGLYPKKERSGYIILSSSNTIKKNEWRTVIETPYSYEFCYDEMEELLDRDKENLYSRLGIDDLYSTEIMLKLDCTKGLWLMIIKHIDPLKHIPEDMLNIKKKKGNNKETAAAQAPIDLMPMSETYDDFPFW